MTWEIVIFRLAIKIFRKAFLCFDISSRFHCRLQQEDSLWNHYTGESVNPR